MTANRATRVRLDADDRKRKLRAASRKVFARRGYASTTLAEIAEHAEVSKALLYHYYSEGRPELYAAVMDDLAGELLAALRPPAIIRHGRDRRLADFVTGVFDFFTRNRDAYAILVREPPGTGEQRLVGAAVALQVELVRQVGTILRSADTDAATAVIVASGAVGFLFSVIELVLSGQVTREEAERRIVGFVLGGVERLESPTNP